MSESLNTPLNSLVFLLGQWQALSKPGEPTGGFSFVSQLQSKVILRTNHADYPATDERPAFQHDDLMVIYCNEAQDLFADYYDSEGHVIHYSGQVNGSNQVIFTSITASPGFRLSYLLETDGTLIGKFEIASPSEPNNFIPYLSWSAVKVS